MENPTPFDLNEAIRRWQQDLAASPAFCADNLEELASHLRASVQKLTATGLSEEEAFQIAIRRTGERGPLSREFAKVNSPVAWSHTVFVFWLVAGMFLLQVALSLSASIVYSIHSYRLGDWILHGPRSLVQMYVWFSPPVYLSPEFQFNAAIVLVLAFCICARLIVGEWKNFNRLIRCFEHPGRAALYLTLLGLASDALPVIIMACFHGWLKWLALGNDVKVRTNWRMVWPGHFASSSLIIVWVLALVFLARRALRNNALALR